MSFHFPIDVVVGTPIEVILEKNHLREEMTLKFGLFTYRDLAELSQEIRDARINGLKKNKDALNDNSAGILISRLSVASNDELNELLMNSFRRLWCLQKCVKKFPENASRLQNKSLEDILLHIEINEISERILIASGFIEPVSIKTENPSMPKEPIE